MPTDGTGHRKKTNMNIIIRDERKGDETVIAAITTAAFKTIAEASGTESAIIDALRAAKALTISLVAEKDGEIVGHVAFSPATLDDFTGWYGLGPVAVRPDLHHQGIGSALIEKGLARLEALGASGCVVVGDPNYYARFGFRSRDGLVCDGVPMENTMALGFGSAEPRGTMGFHPAFFTAS